MPDNQPSNYLIEGCTQEQVLDNLSEIVIITNLSNQIIYVNKEFTRTLYYDSNQILSLPLESLIKSDNQSGTEFVSRIPDYTIKNWTFLTKPGVFVDLLIYSFPYLDNEGSISGRFYISIKIPLSENIAKESPVIDFFRINRSNYYKLDRQFIIMEYVLGIPDDIFCCYESAIGKKIHETLPFEFSRKIIKTINDILNNSLTSTIDIKLQKTNGKLYQAGIRQSIDGNIIILIQQGLGNLFSRESLKRTESRFRLIWEKSVDGMRLLDSFGRMVALNPSFGRIVEIDTKELIGKKYYEVYDTSENDIKLLDEEYAEKFKSHSFDEFFITKLRLKSGRYVFLEVSNNFIDSYQGDLDLFGGEILLFSILRDITDRKAAEDKLRDREELYRSLIETSPDAICLYIPEGQIITCNQQTAELFGFVNINEMLEYNDNFYDYFSETSRQYAIKDSKKIIEYGHLNNMEYEFIRFDESVFYGELSSSVISNRVHHPGALVSVLRNVTERIISSEKIKRSELLFRSVWQNSKDGMRLTNSEGTIVEVNKAFSEMVEMTPEELIGKNLYSMYKLRSKEDYERKLIKYKLDFLRRNYKPKYNIMHTLNNGKRLILDSSFSFVESQNQEVLLLSVLRDVTEKRAIEEALNHNAKLAAVGKMALYLTHEIKTPLSSIKLNVDILTQTLILNEHQNRSFIILKKELKRLEKLLKDVLHFSKTSDLNVSELDFYMLIENIREILLPVLSEKNISFLNNINSFKIEGDYQKLLSAILQVLENCVEAISYSGTIELTSKAQPDGIMSIFIRDNGGGIEDPEKIFEPFYTTKSSGTGLGLAIAKNIIEHHYGSIKLVSSKPGETIFEILFNTGN